MCDWVHRSSFLCRSVSSMEVDTVIWHQPLQMWPYWLPLVSVLNLIFQFQGPHVGTFYHRKIVLKIILTQESWPLSFALSKSPRRRSVVGSCSSTTPSLPSSLLPSSLSSSPRPSRFESHLEKKTFVSSLIAFFSINSAFKYGQWIYGIWI